MLVQDLDSLTLEELVHERNQLAYRLAGATEAEQATLWFLEQEELMNHLTLQIDRLRRDLPRA